MDGATRPKVLDQLLVLMQKSKILVLAKDKITNYSINIIL